MHPIPTHHYQPTLPLLFCSLLLLTTTIPLQTALAQPPRNDCYGFLVPLPAGTDTTEETFANSKVRHLINDLLRENITVYWSTTDFTTASKAMNNTSGIHDNDYTKGTFIIPFSEDTNKTALITAIIYDYNQTHELEDNDTISIEAYKLMDPLSVNTYQLVEPKIAQHLGQPTRYGWPCYLQMAEAGGFLTMEFLLDNETLHELNNDDFNVFMWPYNPDPGTIVEQVLSLSHKDTCNAIRTFVRDGGGYIGSCYGAFAASSGALRPIPLVSLRRAYFPYLSCIVPFVSFSLSDSLMDQRILANYGLYLTTSAITDTGHPVSFGLNTTVQEFFDGPWFVWLGRNTGEIAIFQDMVSAEDRSFKSANLKRTLIGSPNWVHSSFGEGKTVLFSSHPEFVNNISLLFGGLDWEGDKYYGRRAIHNALFYVIAQGPMDTTIDVSHPVSLIEAFGDRTRYLAINGYNNAELDDIKNRILTLNNDLHDLQNTSLELLNRFADRFGGNPIFERGTQLLTYTYHFCNIFQDLNNKTRKTLTLLEQVYPLVENNDSVLLKISQLQSHLSWRLNQTGNLMTQIQTIAQNLQDLLQHEHHSLCEQLVLLSERRNLLRTFEIGLKYIPQLYFESLKLLRHLWYEYETSIAMSTD